MIRRVCLVLLAIGLQHTMISTATSDDARDQRTLRAGMIGLDTSHVIAFTRIFNAEQPDTDVAGVRIVAGYPGGTDIPASRDRVGQFTAQLREMGIEIVDTIPELLERVDVVLLESVDGRVHLDEVRPVIAAGKPVFIDKPMAGSLVEAIMIFELAERAGVPCFSSSSIRFGDDLLASRTSERLGGVMGCDAYGPCSYQEGIPDLFFYGIHGVEGLYTVMGPGCRTVQRIHTPDTDVVVGVWEEGRIGTFRGIRGGAYGFGFTVFGKKAIVRPERGEYQQLCREIARFFRTGVSPVPAEETIEVLAFMEAADRSRAEGGAAIDLPQVIKQARQEALQRLASE